MDSVKGRKRMLADDLAELFNPAPAAEVDPDAFEHGGDAVAPPDAAFEDDDDVDAAALHSSQEAGLRLRSDIDLEDAEYRGNKTSRAAMFGDTGNDTGSESDQEGEEGDSGDETGSQEGSDDDLDEEGGFLSESEVEDDEAPVKSVEGRRGNSKAKVAPESASIRHSKHAVDDEEDDDEQPSDEMLEGSAAQAAAAAAALTGVHDSEELRQLEAAYRGVVKEDEAAMVTMRQRSDKERIKGLAVRNQQVLYERSLEVRILLQKCLVGANTLPRPQTYALIKAEHPQLRDGFSGLRSELVQTLGTLMQLQDTLTARVPGVPRCPAASAIAAAAVTSHTSAHAATAAPLSGDDDNTPAPHSAAKRQKLGNSIQPSASATAHVGSDVDTEGGVTLDALWQGLQEQHVALAGFRDSAVDRWQRRTAVSSGSVALRSHLRALHQSVSSQVAALLKEPTKALKRSRLPLSLRPTVLCEPAIKDAQPGAAGAQAAAVPVSSTIAVEAMDPEEGPRDEETFDDAEFYQQLLKEFLETQGMAGAGANIQKGPKKRKLVDRRASKGRKIRYTVQDKLVNFMAPVVSETPPFAVQLFANLFGHGGRS